MASKSALVSALIDKKLEDEEDTDVSAINEKGVDETAAGAGEEEAASSSSSSSSSGSGVGASGKLPPALAQWVTAGAAGLKVAAGVGANLAAGAAEATRSSLIRVQEATRNISFASADSVRYLQLYDNFAKAPGTIEITIAAGSVNQTPFFVPRGRAIVWKVLVKTLDVAFSMKLRVQELGGAVEHELDGEQKITAGEFFVGEKKAIDFEVRCMSCV